MIKLSVITINYNNKIGLERTILSVIDQKTIDIEFIIIDGNSTDGSKEIIQKYQHKINYWVSEKDTGIYNAQNKGILASNGHYLLFLNSGDYLFNNTVLPEVIKQLDDTDIVYGDILMQSEDGTVKTEVLPDQIDARHLMVSTIWHPSAFIQRKLFNSVGLYDETYKIAADYDFFVNSILKHKVSAKHLNLIISVFERSGVSSDPKQFHAMWKERKNIQNKYFSKDQLEQMSRIEIFQAGRNSRFFNFLPKNLFFLKLYDAFYYRWYKMRSK